jgi:hypothetical protein
MIPFITTTLALVDFGHSWLNIEISNIVLALISGVSKRHLIILVIIWLLVWPGLVEGVGSSTELALVLLLVVSSLWSYRVLAKKFFVKILFNKRALFIKLAPKIVMGLRNLTYLFVFGTMTVRQN